MLLYIPTPGEAIDDKFSKYFSKPAPLLSRFSYPKLLSLKDEEAKRVKHAKQISKKKFHDSFFLFCFNLLIFTLQQTLNCFTTDWYRAWMMIKKRLMERNKQGVDNQFIFFFCFAYAANPLCLSGWYMVFILFLLYPA